MPDIAHFNWADLALSYNVKTSKNWYKRTWTKVNDGSNKDGSRFENQIR